MEPENSLLCPFVEPYTIYMEPFDVVVGGDRKEKLTNWRGFVCKISWDKSCQALMVGFKSEQ